MENQFEIIFEAYTSHLFDDDHDIAQFFYEQFYLFKETAIHSSSISKKRYFNKLIKKINELIYQNSSCKDFKDRPTIDEVLMEKSKILNSFPHSKISSNRVNQSFKQIMNSVLLDIKLEDNNQDNSFIFIKNNYTLDLSILKYLKNEAKRAMIANSIDELDKDFKGNTSLSKEFDVKDNSHQDFEEIYSILKPLGGKFYEQPLLSTSDMLRLKSYVKDIILNGKLPQNVATFPTLNIKPILFISKTIHLVYVHNGKRNKPEYVKLTKLFMNFKDQDTNTIKQKFSKFDGDYNSFIKRNINY